MENNKNGPVNSGPSSEISVLEEIEEIKINIKMMSHSHMTLPVKNVLCRMLEVIERIEKENNE
ncbi:MAG: hypothetical protein GWO20_06835 [Candidatus Korarchaeota archaeon]|nr:hypothetical protein [Candidatus Korarchaeota archaeon]NIU83161.1 hypothetical protein [Candidatus Thorarchaeota archaeon]NIW13543.1 hypothetical protein [Candidatus Thorarchaeota archaeon]NIW51641.1 hypothetical protein [Candidatus Korarchaeota archaeon]